MSDIKLRVTEQANGELVLVDQDNRRVTNIVSVCRVWRQGSAASLVIEVLDLDTAAGTIHVFDGCAESVKA